MNLLGLDVGGTFTDLVGFDESSGEIRVAKVPSTPENQAVGIIHALDAIDIDLSNVRHLIHGTTVATNAILERKGAKVGVVTTEGFRDTLEIGRTRRLMPGGLFNPRFVNPAPIVPRSLRFEVHERLRHDGVVLHKLKDQDLSRIARELHSAGAEAIAICFLHSYRNPIHERRARSVLRSLLPSSFITISSDVVAEFREFERFSTTVLNAYVSPVVERYLKALDRELVGHRHGLRVFTMSSSGGIITTAHAATMGVLTVLSGPVGGVKGALAIGKASGFTHLITYDMGGTSTDVCLIDNLAAVTSAENVVAGLPLRIAQVNINTVGAGGGSVASFDGTGLHVGPRSAGAVPGPASYGRGGTEPTVTDANCVLGRIGSDRLLGGAIRLDAGLALEAFKAGATGRRCTTPPSRGHCATSGCQNGRLDSRNIDCAWLRPTRLCACGVRGSGSNARNTGR